MHQKVCLILNKHPVVDCILSILLIGFIIWIIYTFYDNKFQFSEAKFLGKTKNLEFPYFKDILKNPSKYTFYAPYGVENALIAFNSETPYILDVIQTCIDKNKSLMEKYKSSQDPSMLMSYLDIEIKLASLIIISGIKLINKCKYFCDNSSKSFQVTCDSKLIYDYIVSAERLHDQFGVLKNDSARMGDILKISRTMYNEYFIFFEKINKLISFQINKTSKEEK